MKTIYYSTQAKKDLKRYRRDLSKMQHLYAVLKYLANDEELPAKYHPHMLSGEYKGCLECHIENDYLLIWIDNNDIYIQRVGTHSELFSNGRKK